MLRSVGLQRVGHGLVTEQRQEELGRRSRRISFSFCFSCIPEKLFLGSVASVAQVRMEPLRV